MPLTYHRGTIFQSTAQVLVNTVNCEGVMGAGLAQEFKIVYPDMFAEYRALCLNGDLRPGVLHLYKPDGSPWWILNFPTKDQWVNKSEISYLELGLQKFVDIYQKAGITSIAFPLLGCRNGKLKWETEVKPVMERYLKDLPIKVEIWIDPFNNVK